MPTHLLAETEDVLALFSQDAVHGGIVGDHDVILHVRLRRRQAELDQTHLQPRDVRQKRRNLQGSRARNGAICMTAVAAAELK